MSHNKYRNNDSSSSCRVKYVPGPAGPAGPQGPPGPAGAAGAPGAPGAPGANCGGCGKKNSYGYYCKQVYENEIQPTLVVGVSPDNAPYSEQDISNNYIGFDPELIKRIAELMPCTKSIRYVNYDSVEDAFQGVRAADIDVYADSSVAINTQRLASGLSFICTDAATLTAVALFYYAGYTVDTILSAAPPGSNPLTVLRDSSPTPPTIIGLGSGSVQQNTLLSLPGGPYPFSSILGDPTLSASSTVNIYTALNTPADAFFSDANVSTPADISDINDLIAGSMPQLKYTIINLPAAQVGRGNGYAVNSARCKLQLDMQTALDELIDAETYPELEQLVLDEGLEPIFIVAPEKCHSVWIGSISKACLDGCDSCASACKGPHNIVVLKN